MALTLYCFVRSRPIAHNYIQQCMSTVKYRPRNILIRGCPYGVSIPAPYHRWSVGVYPVIYWKNK